MSERPPVTTYIWAAGWLAGIGWAALNVEADTTFTWLFVVGLVAVLWLGIWSAIFGVLMLFAGAVGLFIPKR